jgi:hypothetical protein
MMHTKSFGAAYKSGEKAEGRAELLGVIRVTAPIHHASWARSYA